MSVWWRSSVFCSCIHHTIDHFWVYTYLCICYVVWCDNLLPMQWHLLAITAKCLEASWLWLATMLVSALAHTLQWLMARLRVMWVIAIYTVFHCMQLHIEWVGVVRGRQHSFIHDSLLARWWLLCVCVVNSKESEWYHGMGSSMNGAPPGLKTDKDNLIRESGPLLSKRPLFETAKEERHHPLYSPCYDQYCSVSFKFIHACIQCKLQFTPLI